MNTYNYDNVSDWLRASQADCTIHDRASRKTTEYYTESWSGTSSFEESIHLATHGWREGAIQAKAVSIELQEELMKLSSHKTRMVRPARHGGRLIVSKALEGLPYAYTKVEKHINPRFLHLVYNGTTSAGIDANTMIRKGVIVAGIVDALELHNFRVKVSLVFNIVAAKTVEFIIKLKDYSEPMELDRLVFYTANPSSFRRICFSVMECHQYARDMGVGYGYGYQGEATDRGDIYVAKSTYGNKEWSSPELAFKYVKKQLADKGIEVGE